jgi:AraC-type DNA-binding domain-containing proteins
MLAKSYLTNTAMTTDEIAYLLGYLEVNSFLRAFATWTGVSASDYRQQVTKA